MHKGIHVDFTKNKKKKETSLRIQNNNNKKISQHEKGFVIGTVKAIIQYRKQQVLAVIYVFYFK